MRIPVISLYIAIIYCLFLVAAVCAIEFEVAVPLVI